MKNLIILIILIINLIPDQKYEFNNEYVTVNVMSAPNEETEVINNTKIDVLTTYTDDARIFIKDRIKYTDNELNDLEMLVEHEAGAESFRCKLYIASVIINRVLDERFPDNLNDVIYDTFPVRQFPPSSNLYKVASDNTKEAVQKALKQDYADGAWIFNNKSLTDGEVQQWFEKFEIVADIDGVQFRR